MKELNFLQDFFKQIPWNQESSSLWPVSTFTIKRNLAFCPFPRKQSALSALHIKESIMQALSKLASMKDSIFLDYSQLSPAQREFVCEHFFFPEGVMEDQPHQGFIIDPSGTLLIGINFSDHLILHKIDYSCRWYDSWNSLHELENSLNDELHFAFSPQFGYVTSDIGCCGLGTTLRAYLHLPAFLQAEHETNSSLFDEDSLCSIVHTPMQDLDTNESDELFEGDLLILQNKYHLGISEESLLRSLYATANHLMNTERSLRSEMKSGSFSDIKDLVSRSFGILLHSYQLHANEALAALSFLKLGIDLGWIEGLSDEQTNAIFFTCRRGHLLVKESTSLSQEELLHKRATYIHGALKDAKLVI